MRSPLRVPVIFLVAALVVAIPSANAASPIAPDSPVGKAQGFDMMAIGAALDGAWQVGASIDSGKVAAAVEFRGDVVTSYDDPLTYTASHRLIAPCVMHTKRTGWSDDLGFKKVAIGTDGTVVITPHGVGMESKTHIVACAGVGGSRVYLYDKATKKCRSFYAGDLESEGKGTGWEASDADCRIKDGAFVYGLYGDKLDVRRGSLWLDKKSAQYVATKKPTFAAAVDAAQMHLEIEATSVDGPSADALTELAAMFLPVTKHKLPDTRPMFMVGRAGGEWRYGFGRHAGYDAKTSMVGAYFNDRIHWTERGFARATPAASAKDTAGFDKVVLITGLKGSPRLARRSARIRNQVEVETSDGMKVLSMSLPADGVLPIHNGDPFGHRVYWTDGDKDVLGTVIAKSDDEVWVVRESMKVGVVHVVQKKASEVTEFSLKRLRVGAKVRVHKDPLHAEHGRSKLIDGTIVAVEGNHVGYTVRLSTGKMVHARFYDTVPVK